MTAASSLTDRLGAGQRTKHIDNAALVDTRTSSRRRHQYQEGAYSEELRRWWNEASLCFSTATTLQVCRIGMPLPQDDDEPVTELQHRNRQLSTLCGEHRDRCRCAKLGETKERWTSLVLITMNGSRRGKEREEDKQDATRNFCEQRVSRERNGRTCITRM